MIDGDNSIDEARAAILEKIGTSQVEQPIRSTDVTSNDLGLSQQETKRFSFLRALNYLASPGDATARREAEFEIEVGIEAAKKYDRSSNGIVVPNEVLRRDLNVGAAPHSEPRCRLRNGRTSWLPLCRLQFQTQLRGVRLHRQGWLDS